MTPTHPPPPSAATDLEAIRERHRTAPTLTVLNIDFLRAHADRGALLGVVDEQAKTLSGLRADYESVEADAAAIVDAFIDDIECRDSVRFREQHNRLVEAIESVRDNGRPGWWNRARADRKHSEGRINWKAKAQAADGCFAIVADNLTALAKHIGLPDGALDDGLDPLWTAFDALKEAPGEVGCSECHAHDTAATAAEERAKAAEARADQAEALAEARMVEVVKAHARADQERALAADYRQKWSATNDALEIAQRATEKERARAENTCAAMLMIGSEVGGDPKMDPTDHRDPRWTPALAAAAQLRARADALAAFYVAGCVYLDAPDCSQQESDAIDAMCEHRNAIVLAATPPPPVTTADKTSGPDEPRTTSVAATPVTASRGADGQKSPAPLDPTRLEALRGALDALDATPGPDWNSVDLLVRDLVATARAVASPTPAPSPAAPGNGYRCMLDRGASVKFCPCAGCIAASKGEAAPAPAAGGDGLAFADVVSVGDEDRYTRIFEKTAGLSALNAARHAGHPGAGIRAVVAAVRAEATPGPTVHHKCPHCGGRDVFTVDDLPPKCRAHEQATPSAGPGEVGDVERLVDIYGSAFMSAPSPDNPLDKRNVEAGIAAVVGALRAALVSDGAVEAAYVTARKATYTSRGEAPGGDLFRLRAGLAAAFDQATGGVAAAGPPITWTSNGEAGDGFGTCSACHEERDEPHAWEECTAKLWASVERENVAAVNFERERDEARDALAAERKARRESEEARGTLIGTLIRETEWVGVLAPMAMTPEERIVAVCAALRDERQAHEALIDVIARETDAVGVSATMTPAERVKQVCAALAVARATRDEAQREVDAERKAHGETLAIIEDATSAVGFGGSDIAWRIRTVCERLREKCGEADAHLKDRDAARARLAEAEGALAAAVAETQVERAALDEMKRDYRNVEKEFRDLGKSVQGMLRVAERDRVEAVKDRDAVIADLARQRAHGVGIAKERDTLAERLGRVVAGVTPLVEAVDEYVRAPVDGLRRPDRITQAEGAALDKVVDAAVAAGAALADAPPPDPLTSWPTGIGLVPAPTHRRGPAVPASEFFADGAMPGCKFPSDCGAPRCGCPRVEDATPPDPRPVGECPVDDRAIVAWRRGSVPMGQCDDIVTMRRALAWCVERLGVRG